jgi:hypothetical protein
MSQPQPQQQQQTPKKRGRRSKDETVNVELKVTDTVVQKNPIKKRGRKPKGGKIIQHNLQLEEENEVKPNIILHLKCSLKDLQYTGDYNSNFTVTNIDPFQFVGSKNELLTYEIISNPNILPNMDSSDEKEDTNKSVDKDVWKKLKLLERELQLNISDKKSACFWCTYDFDNPPIYIPKHFIKDSYHVYGCFCSPECASAFLMEENIDSSIKFERYYLLNNIYSKIFQYKKNIKPAPNPFYMLEKYYGNLSIQEYRMLLKTEKLFILVDKPLTRILPEYHEDNDDFIINNKIIPSNNFQLKKNPKKTTKSNILSEKFGLS